jgi:hypothetical protein
MFALGCWPISRSSQNFIFLVLFEPFSRKQAKPFDWKSKQNSLTQAQHGLAFARERVRHEPAELVDPKS